MKKLSWHYKKLIFFFKRRINLDKKIKYKTLDNLFNYFGTDKGTKNPYDLNPNEFGHGFAESYEKHLNKFKNEKINFLEIGTSEGASLASFTQYFSNANIYGIDRNSYLDDSDRSEIFFKNIIQSIKDKKFFKSMILTKEDQMYLFDSIKYINVYKGKMVDEQGKNVSDIVFFKKK